MKVLCQYYQAQLLHTSQLLSPFPQLTGILRFLRFGAVTIAVGSGGPIRSIAPGRGQESGLWHLQRFWTKAAGNQHHLCVLCDRLSAGGAAWRQGQSANNPPNAVA